MTTLAATSTSSKHLITSCLLGNMLEFYEFAIFGYLATTLAPLFFPSESAFISLLATYGAFACGFFMRPLGGVFLGYMGDKYGRKFALMLSLFLMAIPTALMGLLPTYASIGIAAPILLTLCRLVQGFSMGGEFTGAVVYLIENAPQNRKGFFSAWADLGGSFGMIFACLTILSLNTILSPEDMSAWGWRAPFLISIFIGVLGVLMRSYLPESPLFSAANTHKSPLPLLKDIWQNHRSFFLLCISLLCINTVGYYVLIIFVPKLNSGFLSPATISVMTFLNLSANIPGYFLAAILSDKIGCAKGILFGCAGCFFLAPLLIYGTGNWPFEIQVPIQMIFSFFLGATFGPRSSLMASLFPPKVRYTAISASYNLTNGILGGTTPMICLSLIAYTQDNMAAALFVMVAATVSTLSVRAITRRQS